MKDEQKLLQYKKAVDSARQIVDRRKGELSAAQSRLKKEFKINTVAEGKKLLKKMKSDILKKEDTLHTQINKLEAAYEWDQ